jgi:hypothetical protein
MGFVVDEPILVCGGGGGRTDLKFPQITKEPQTKKNTYFLDNFFYAHPLCANGNDRIVGRNGNCVENKW